MFQAVEANFGQLTHRPLERPTQDTQNGYDLYSAHALFVRPRVNLVRPLQR